MSPMENKPECNLSNETNTGSGSMQNEYQQQVNTLGQESQSMMDKTREQMKDAAGQLKDTARATLDEGKQKAVEASDRLKERSQEMLNQQKDKMANHLHQYSVIFHDAANRFREENDPNIADYTEAIADRVDSLSSYLRDKDMKRLVQDTEALAYRRPVLFFSGMFLVGLAISRFLKASRTYRFEPEGDWNAGYRPEEDVATAGYGSDYPQSGTERDYSRGYETTRSGDPYRRSGSRGDIYYRDPTTTGSSYTQETSSDYRSSTSMGSTLGASRTGTGSSHTAGTEGLSGSETASGSVLGASRAASTSSDVSDVATTRGMSGSSTPETGSTHENDVNIQSDEDIDRANADTPKSKKYDL